MPDDVSTAPIKSGAPSAVGVLRDNGIRITASRVAVLSAVDEAPHIDADAVAHVVRDRLGAVSTQAIYDALALFTRLGLVRRFKPSGLSALYETRVDDNHHHMVCRRCAVIADVNCATATAPCLSPTTTNGFLIDEAEVIYWGLCPTCRNSTADQPASDENSLPQPTNNERHHD